LGAIDFACMAQKAHRGTRSLARFKLELRKKS
jgi:hypothetical protein